MNERWETARLPVATVPRRWPGMTMAEFVRELIVADCVMVWPAGCETREDHAERLAWDGCQCGNGVCG